MKKLLTVLLAMMLICMVIGCTEQKEENPDVNPEAPLVGGWTVNTDFPKANIPEAPMAAFQSALSEYTGSELTPVAFLASQVVGGMNYSFLALCEDKSAPLCSVSVYDAAGGNATITGVTPIAISDYTQADTALNFPEDGLSGGWSVQAQEGTLPGDVQSAFESAVSGMTDIEYTPVAFLGSQVVAGNNYAILCTATNSKGQSLLAVMVVYADLSGGAEILNVAPFAY